MPFIYGLIDPITNQLRYIGYTAVSIEHRAYGHWRERKGKPSHKNNWINYLWDNYGVKPEVVEIEQLSEDQWQEAECFWIEYFRSIGANLTNNAIGGLGRIKGTKLSLEHCKAISKGLKGKTKGIAKPYMRGKPAWNSGKKGYKLQVSRKGNPNYSKPGISGADNTRSKDFILVSPAGYEIRFTGVRAFCREFGLASASNVSALLKGKLKSYCGWTCKPGT